MDYQPLSPENNDIRLLYFTQDKQSLVSTVTSEYPQGIVRLVMKTVSLDDYTKESQELMESNGTRLCSAKDYLKSKELVLAETEDRAAGLQRIANAVRDLYASPAFGRWSWGDYTALSYTWGEIGATRLILVNGHPMKVTENLEDFLRRHIMDIVEVVGGEKRMGYWVDAICINQNDVEERNVQVKRMKDIYMRASGTMIWLGNAADGSDKAMDAMTFVATYAFRQGLSTREEMVAFMAALLDKQHFLEVGIWKALQDLLSRPYWWRLWIIQEIALSTDSLSVVCGSKIINWPFLLLAIDVFASDWGTLLRAVDLDYKAMGIEDYDSSIFANSVNRILQLRIFRDAAFRGVDHPDLKKLLWVVRGARQMDPRDKVYGILSLVDHRLSELITPNYNLSTSEVFIGFAKAIISWSGSLDIITNPGGYRSVGRVLPSWMPDWTDRVHVTLEMTEKVSYQSSQNSNPVINFDSGNLIARGFIIDKIDGLGHADSSYSTKEEDFENDITQPIHNENPYQHTAGLRNALWRTLVLNRDSKGDIAPDSYAGLLEIPWPDEDSEASSSLLQEFQRLKFYYNKELQIGGQNLKSYFPIGTDIDSAMAGIGNSRDSLDRVTTTVYGRRLIITAKGYIGQARKETRRGDIVCILLGCSIPVILRPGTDGLSYKVVGESYIHGIMEGEAMEWLKAGQYSLENFTIS
ncbi:uncharacterized protein PAC_16763 [Phialocephala subalpina]|uniref:Heterokaryon incompatibility domain-containing protein n=1 Tax=Phialocephala subalpina TaxID=576137 RepID=A0A1L7XPC2_9HELO|nr:uncharacterized protein PAC_16763 [Phialocephala subalpina]